MSTQNIALFKALAAKMSYHDQRQSVISQNIANADTPGYRPNDLEQVDFARMLGQEQGKTRITPVTTQQDHMPNPDEIMSSRAKDQKNTYEVAPAGNSVIIEEQLINANRNAMDFNLVTNLYQKNVGMFRMALGR